MSKYKVIDRQQCNFMCDTEEEPMTLNALRKRFWSLEDCRTQKYSQFTIEYISDTWEVDIVKAEEE